VKIGYGADGTITEVLDFYDPEQDGPNEHLHNLILTRLSNPPKAVPLKTKSINFLLVEQRYVI
jgi:hypothetical protein